MRCRVYPLRRPGRRLTWREVQNSPVSEGELRTHYSSLDNARYFYFVASLVQPGDALCQPILPDLWEPILINAGNWALQVSRLLEYGTQNAGRKAKGVTGYARRPETMARS